MKDERRDEIDTNPETNFKNSLVMVSLLEATP
jgi:hypothetical protein